MWIDIFKFCISLFWAGSIAFVCHAKEAPIPEDPQDRLGPGLTSFFEREGHHELYRRDA